VPPSNGWFFAATVTIRADPLWMKTYQARRTGAKKRPGVFRPGRV
jgi:hypothetical protein